MTRGVSGSRAPYDLRQEWWRARVGDCPRIGDDVFVKMGEDVEVRADPYVLTDSDVLLRE